MVEKKMLQGVKVLIVDDNCLIQQALKVELEGCGCDIALAENGKEAIEKLKIGHYDIVLMDIMMPVMNGDEAVKIIRESISKELPIIAITAYSQKPVKDRCLAAGMNDFMVKPLDMELLKKKMMKYVGKSPKA
jgi:CheY-like chemotaxis protein